MEGLMRERRTANQIQRLLQEAERDLAKGLTFADVSRKLGISRVTLFRWRAQRRSPQTEDARHVRELEGEIERLKRLVAELMLDKQMLQDVAKKKWCPPPSNARPPTTFARRMASPSGGPAGSWDEHVRRSGTAAGSAPGRTP